MATRIAARLRHATFGTVLTALAFAAMSASGVAQVPVRANDPVDLPNGPAKPGFDIRRFSNAGNGWFETFYVKQTERLRDALKIGKVAEDTRLLVTDVSSGRLALITDQMGYHHLAQGSSGGKDWLVSF
jgi:hypothetical protein